MLASLAILCRDLLTCGQPFVVDEDTPCQQKIKDEYLYAWSKPDALRVGSTEMLPALWKCCIRKNKFSETVPADMFQPSSVQNRA